MSKTNRGAAKKIVGVIPARLESARLPRKPLLNIMGHPLVAWVYARAHAAPELSQLLVATDSDEIVEWCRSLRIPAMITSPAHRSGTDRILEVMAMQQRMGEEGEIYVNIQGDEPAVDVEHIRLLLQPFAGHPEMEVTTLKVKLSAAEAGDPNRVKVVTGSDGRALYFSRSPVPYERDAQGAAAYYKHLGFYAYSVSALAKFRHLRPGPLERTEKLEQLRFLENGISITVLETQRDTVSVDTKEDLVAVEEYFKRAGIRFPDLE